MVIAGNQSSIAGGYPPLPRVDGPEKAPLTTATPQVSDSAGFLPLLGMLLDGSSGPAASFSFEDTDPAGEELENAGEQKPHDKKKWHPAFCTTLPASSLYPPNSFLSARASRISLAAVWGTAADGGAGLAGAELADLEIDEVEAAAGGGAAGEPSEECSPAAGAPQAGEALLTEPSCDSRVLPVVPAAAATPPDTSPSDRAQPEQLHPAPSSGTPGGDNAPDKGAPAGRVEAGVSAAAAAPLAFAARLMPAATPDAGRGGSRAEAQASPSAPSTSAGQVETAPLAAASADSGGETLSGDSRERSTGDGTAERNGYGRQPAPAHAGIEYIPGTPRTAEQNEPNSLPPEAGLYAETGLPAEPGKGATSARPSDRLTLHLEGSRQEQIAVQVRETRGAVEVAVKTSDQSLTGALREGLSDLGGELVNRGYQAELWNPGGGGQESQPREGDPGQQRQGSGNQQNEANPQGGGGREDSRRRARPGWLEQLEQSFLNTRSS